MDSLNANYPKSLKYIDNEFDSKSKLDSAFPGKIIFQSECFTKNLNSNNDKQIDKNNNIEKFRGQDDKILSLEKKLERTQKKIKILIDEHDFLEEEYDILEEEYKILKKKYKILDKKVELETDFKKNNLEKLEKKFYNDNNQMSTDNNTKESFSNYILDNNVNTIIEYNKELTEKQKVQKDKIELVKEKEANLIKVNAALKSSNDRNNFKRKIIYTLIALIFFVFLMCLSTYIYFVRDFKVSK